MRADFTQAAPFDGGKGGKGGTLARCFLPVVEAEEKGGTSLAGMAADEARVFASDPDAGKVRVFDAETMREQANWPVERAGPIALDARGRLWVLQNGDSRHAPLILVFDAAGKPAGAPLKIAGDRLGALIPAFCLGPEGTLFALDGGPAQNVIRVRQPDGDAPAFSRLGVEGGILAPPAGAFGDWRLHGASAIGCDAAGNLYLAHHGSLAGGSTVLESYGADEKLRWRLFGLTFIDLADVDPADDTQVFTKEERFTMDYAQPPGREWRYAAGTVDRTRFPDDPRLRLHPTGAWVRRIGGQRVLFSTDMTAERLLVHRFEGEIARPSGIFAKAPIDAETVAGWPAAPPGRGAWIWRDDDGDGRPGAGEFLSDDGKDAPPAQGWWVDAEGGVCLATERAGLRYFPPLGLDARGNPRWSFATARSFPHPAEFTEVKRLRYLPESDTLFLAGTTAEDANQHWKPGGPVFARYDGWLRGACALRWKIVAPYERGAHGHESCEPMGFDVAGDFVFVPYTGKSEALGFSFGHVEVFRAADGAGVGHFDPSAEVGEIGLQDVRECLRAHRRADGEYLVFLEDDLKSKVVLYRWRPAPGDVSTPPPPFPGRPKISP